MRFADAYVTPQCTPPRSTLFTGQYTACATQVHVLPPDQYPYARVGDVPPLATFLLPKGLQAVSYPTTAISAAGQSPRWLSVIPKEFATDGAIASIRQNQWKPFFPVPEELVKKDRAKGFPNTDLN